MTKIRFKGGAVLDVEEVLEAAQSDDNRGFCVRCGAEAYGVEPDARKYECESCGAHSVYGAEELVMHFAC